MREPGLPNGDVSASSSGDENLMDRRFATDCHQTAGKAKLHLPILGATLHRRKRA
jgi:hypothetical protein